MKPFQYASALSTDSARQFASGGGAYLAGGNDLLGRMKECIDSPPLVVNIKSIPGLDAITPGAHAWTLGALVTIARIEGHPQIRETFPALQQAAAEVGSQQIRNVATLGGNLAQHSRCWYFRHRDTLCLKKHGDLCYARHGENRYHSLFSGCDCISPVVSNLATALTALDATVVVLRDGKHIHLTMAEFYQKAWDTATAHNSLKPGDLIVQVEIPVARTQSAYMQISDKHAFDWALVSCAAAARVKSGKLSHARVALGCISPIPHQSKAANAYLDGKPLDEATASHAADLLLEGAKPQKFNGYKIPMAHALIRRALLALKA